MNTMSSLPARLFLCLALSACSADAYESASSAIVDGTVESGFPEVMFLFNLAQGSACTATLIAPRVALTAKHCVQDGRAARAAAARNFRLFVGTSANRPTASYNIAEVRPAPGRWDISDATDVALLILASPATQTPREVSFDNPTRLTRQPFTAIGYGQTPSGSSGTKLIVQRIVDGVQRGFIFVQPSVCSGDSGGPLIGTDERIWGVASFIFSQTGGQPRCGTAPGAYNTLRSFQEFIETAIEDTGGCFPSDEVCNGIDDNCDGVVDEGCTALGETCSDSSECTTELCAGTNIGQICTQECDPLRPRIGCAPGFFCEGGPDCSGLCVPDSELSLELDAACERSADCASGLCSGGVCASPCRVDGGGCFAGEVCGGGGACGACISAESSMGPRALGESCEDDAQCAEGTCFEELDVAYCSRACTDDAACGMGFHCRGGTCIRGPREGLGGTCQDNEDCEGGFCVSFGDRRWCSDFCDTGEDCPSGFSCQAAGESTICQPDLGILGEGCMVNEDCADGLCVNAAGGPRCSRFCDGTDPCAPGFDCVRVGDTGVCLAPNFGEDTSSGGDAGRDSGGCNTASPASGASLIFLLGAAFFIRRRR